MKRLISLVLTFLLFLAPMSFARGHSSSSSYHSSKSTSSKSYKAAKSSKKTSYSVTGKHKKTYCATCQRDKKGKILRSEKARKAFEKQTGYPHGRPGYVIDHIKPLKEGGADNPSNMQWQTKAEAKAKDKTE
jgi:hypothetical protein